MRSEPSGLAIPGLSLSSSAFGIPCASRARHIAGSHDTLAVRLTCWKTQAAARLRVVISARRAAALAPRDVAVVVGLNSATDPAASTAITRTDAPARR